MGSGLVGPVESDERLVVLPMPASPSIRSAPEPALSGRSDEISPSSS
jgi:hypothetical protein